MPNNRLHTKDKPLLHSQTQSEPGIQGKKRNFSFTKNYLRLSVLLLILLLISGLPHALARTSDTSERVYMGIVFGVADTSQYFSWLRAHQESLVVSNWMTPEPNQPAFFNLLWLILGQLALWTGLSMPAVFQILRVVAGLSYGLTLYWLYGMLSESRRERWLATILVLIGAGVGWIWVIDKYLTGSSELRYWLDVQVAEPNAFLSLIAFPHFLLAAAFMFLVFGFFLRGERTGQMRYYLLAALSALLLSTQHAYDLFTLYFVIGAYLLLRWWNERQIPWNAVFGLIIIGLISSPPAAYFAYLTTTDPIWRQVLAQFSNANVYTPNILHLLIIFGPQMPLAIAALPALWKRRNNADLFWLSWVVVGFALLYIPTDFQIHMLNPYQVPLAILAIRTCLRIAEQPGNYARLRRWLPIGLIAFASIINIYLLAWRIIDLSRQETPYFLHRDELSALEWLNQQNGHDVVLSTEAIGHFVPALAGKRAVLAHWAQSIDYYTKTDEVAAFFSPETSASERQRIIERYNVKYIVLPETDQGPIEQILDQHYSKTLDLPNATVYRVP